MGLFEIAKNTFRIRKQNGEGHGTTFVVNHNNQTFFITATHVLFDYGRICNDIYIEIGGKFSKYTISEFYWTGFDVLGFTLKDGETFGCTGVNSMSIETPHLYGKKVFCIGFPYDIGIYDNFPDTLNTMPIIKEGIISTISDQNFMVSSFIKQGMSGGPIIIRNVNGNFNVISIISAGGLTKLLDGSGNSIDYKPTIINEFKECKEIEIRIHSDNVLSLPISKFDTFERKKELVNVTASNNYQTYSFVSNFNKSTLTFENKLEN